MSLEPHFSRHFRASRSVVTIAAIVLFVAAPSSAGASRIAVSGSATTVINVIAAENFWGSIAAQIGGKYVRVTSIITNPSTDPHSYEPTASDARSFASAQLAIVNGLGYDPWASTLLATDPTVRKVLTVGKLLALPDGDNPHRWYNPANVQTVVRALVADYATLDPAVAGYFTSQARYFNSVSLESYHALISEIRSRFANTPVGASESIFSMLAPSLGLRLITPPTFLKAISEGGEVSASDKTEIDKQIKHHLIAIYVYNSQNATPDIAAQLSECKAAHIPTATITETLAPATATYEQWQTDQLRGILAALERRGARDTDTR